MIDAIQHLPPHLRARVQQGLRTGNISPPYTIVALNAALNTHDDLQGAVDALNELEALGVGGPAAADILEALDKAASGNQRDGSSVVGSRSSGAARSRYEAGLHRAAQRSEAIGMGEHLCLL